jgi:hypothetical protein
MGGHFGGGSPVQAWQGSSERDESVGEDDDDESESVEESESASEHHEAGFAAPVRHRPFGRALWVMHHGARPVALLLIALAVIPILVTLFWVLPITLGVRIARRRKLTPLWMLFGIHPIGGWVACLVLALGKGNVECAKCGGYVKPNFRQCPFCQGELPGQAPPKPKGS